MKKIILFLLFFIGIGLEITAQQNKADSLEKILSQRLADTLRVNILNEISFAIYSIDPPKSKQYAEEALQIAQKNNFLKGIGYAYNNIGAFYRQKGEFVEALKNLTQALEYFEKSDYRQGIGNTYIGMGLINGQQSNFAQAQSHHLKALKIYESLQDQEHIAVCLSNIGYTYLLQNEYNLALEYYFKSLPISKAANDQWREALCYNHIGVAYSRKGAYDTALQYFEKSITLADRIKLPTGRMFIAKGEAHLAQKEYEKALDALHESLTSFEKAKNKYYIAEASNALGKTYLALRQTDSALFFYQKGREFAQIVGAKAFLSKSYEGIAKTYQAQNRIDSAYKYQSLHIALKDSIYNEDIFRKTAFAKFDYDLDKKQNEIAILEEQHNKEVIFRNMIIVVVLILLFGSILLYRNREEIKKSNSLLNWQNIEIRQKTQEIVLKNNEIMQKNDEIMVQNEELRQQQEEILTQRDDISIKNTELQEQKEKIEEVSRNMAIISEIGQQITATLNLEKAVMILYEYINRIMDADEFGIGTYHDITNKISFDFYIYEGKRLPFFQSSVEDDRFSSWVIKNQKALLFGDISNEYQPYIKDFSYYEGDQILNSMICTPLIIGDRVIGLVSVQSQKKHAYTEYHLDILQTLAAYVSIALENTTSYHIIAEKNKHITDSIRYAQNIQQAILPTEENLSSLFQEYFVIFHPKDLVSGDFYWLSTLSSEQLSVNSDEAHSPITTELITEKVFVAVVDCTGHGVPGAFMSMIGNTLLNEIINIEKITETDQILSRLDQKVRLALRQENSKNQDGMDISLCCIEPQENGFKVSFSGAKNNLIYTKEHEVCIVKGDRQSIGGFQKKGSKRQFTKCEVFLPKNSLLYLFSDGYIDQGNPEDKRLGSRQLQAWIEEVNQENLTFQKQFFLKKLKKHQQNAMQRDDITFLGLKL